MKVSITWDGIHHGTRQGDTESPKYGDLSAVWGEKGPRGKPYLGTLWGNGMSMCMLLSRDCARRGSSYSTIPYGGPSRRLMRYRLTDIREMCWAGSLILGCRALVALTRLPLCSLMNQQSPTYATKFTARSDTHTLHDPIRDAEHARTCGVEDGLGVGGCLMAVEMLATGP